MDLYDPTIGSYTIGSNEENNRIIMTATLEYIIETIGLPPSPSSLTWKENEGIFYPVVSYPERIKIGSEEMKGITAYIDKSKSLDKIELEAEIYYAWEDALAVKKEIQYEKEEMKQLLNQ